MSNLRVKYKKEVLRKSIRLPEALGDKPIKVGKHDDADINVNCLTMVVVHKCFTFFSFLLIFGNTIVLALDRERNNVSTDMYLKKANVYFTAVFGCEMCVKLYGLGIKGYVRDEYNLFDGLLVVISTVDITLE